MQRAASAFAALAASCTPTLAHVAPWSSPDPPPLPVQFLIGIALMAVAGAVILRQGASLARGRERRRGLAEVGRHDDRLLPISGLPGSYTGGAESCLLPMTPGTRATPRVQATPRTQEFPSPPTAPVSWSAASTATVMC